MILYSRVYKMYVAMAEYIYTMCVIELRVRYS
jgi:hypothetical protein